MITTDQLKEKVMAHTKKYFPDHPIQGVHFKKGTVDSPEGTYIFSEMGEYHIVSTEKGKIKENIITQDINDVIYFVSREVIFEIALKFATEHRETGKDFRRTLFSKELELYLKYNIDFYKKRKKEIEAILLQNPYVDRE